MSEGEHLEEVEAAGGAAELPAALLAISRMASPSFTHARKHTHLLIAGVGVYQDLSEKPQPAGQERMRRRSLSPIKHFVWASKQGRWKEHGRGGGDVRASPVCYCH